MSECFRVSSVTSERIGPIVCQQLQKLWPEPWHTAWIKGIWAFLQRAWKGSMLSVSGNHFTLGQQSSILCLRIKFEIFSSTTRQNNKWAFQFSFHSVILYCLWEWLLCDLSILYYSSPGGLVQSDIIFWDFCYKLRFYLTIRHSNAF